MGQVICADSKQLAHRVASEIEQALKGRTTPFHLALSGGSTPQEMFAWLGSQMAAWPQLHLWWGDERCVPADDNESNYGHVRELWLKPARFPQAQIHAVRGEADPAAEAARYAAEIRKELPSTGALPRFDFVLLGMGPDGHTASLFAGQKLAAANDLTGVATHPVSGQKRISFTMPLINAAARVAFVVAGADKASLVKKIFSKDPTVAGFPAAQVSPGKGDLTWYLDEAAVAELRR